MCWPALFLLAVPAQPVPPSELARVERELRQAGLATDGPGLVAYLRAQTPSPEDDVRLTRLVRQLGDDDFDLREEASRELIAAGRKAAAYLRPAVLSKDLEVARRARRCLDAILESPLIDMTPGIVRLLASHRPAGAVPVLIGYLTGASDEAAEDAVFDALRELSAEGKLDPAVVAALEHRAPLCRAAAAHVLGDPNGGDVRRVVPLLRDSDPRVRFEAAQALLRRGDTAGVPVLLDLLAEAPREVAWLAEEVLVRIAGPAGATVPGLGNAEMADRAASAAGWRGWWQGVAAGWKPPAGLDPYLGRTLVVEYDGNPGGGALYELGRDGKRRWQVDGLLGPNHVQPLPGGRFLVAERGGDRVVECDRNGKVYWKQPTGGSPIACQRLPDGSTLVTTFGEVFRVTAEGKRTATYRSGDNLRHARAQPDGTVLVVAGSGTVIELNAELKEVRKITPSNHASGAGYWAYIDRLADGRFLVAFSGVGRVAELDATGKVVRDFNVASPVSAVRLHNGHTLVASFESRQLIELDRDGKEIWKVATRGRPFHAVRY